MKKNTKEFDVTIHHSVKGRKRFKRRMWLIFLIWIIILAGCGALFTVASVTWDPDAGFKPVAKMDQWYQILCAVLGGVIAFAACVVYVIINVKIFSKFYKSQLAYIKTKEFKERKAKALSVETEHLKTSDIKWLKKLCYITAAEKRALIEKQKNWKKECKAKHKKVNYAKSLA